MQILLLKKSSFQICGCYVETSLTDFLNTMLPNAGYTPDIEGNFIEYFPDGINGKYEIWAPLVNADV